MTNEIPEGCLPFDLKLALDGWPAVTRDGREAKFLFVDEITSHRNKFLFVINNSNEWKVVWAYEDGSCGGCDGLFLKKKTRTYWISVFRSKGSKKPETPQVVFESEEKALMHKNVIKESDYLTTIKWEIDEPEEYILPKSRAEIEGKKTKTLWVAIDKDTTNKSLGTFHAVASFDNKILKDHLEEFQIEYSWIKSVEVEIE